MPPVPWSPVDDEAQPSRCRKTAKRAIALVWGDYRAAKALENAGYRAAHEVLVSAAEGT